LKKALLNEYIIKNALHNEAIMIKELEQFKIWMCR